MQMIENKCQDKTKIGEIGGNRMKTINDYDTVSIYRGSTIVLD